MAGVTPVSFKVTQCPSCGRRNRVPEAASGVPRCGSCGQPLPWIVDADYTSFGQVVEDSKLPVLLDLWAPWCGPCRMVSPVLEQLAQSFAGRVKLVKVNVDDSPQVSRRFDVTSIPTLIVMDVGRVIARQTGAAPEPVLRAWLEQALTRT